MLLIGPVSDVMHLAQCLEDILNNCHSMTIIKDQPREYGNIEGDGNCALLRSPTNDLLQENPAGGFLQ